MIISASFLLSSGWRIPEQSSRSVALSGAYTANSHGADTSYYNPANMSFNKDIYQIEASAIYIGLSNIKYDDYSVSTRNSESEKENFFVPTMFLSTKDYDGIRYGLSITAPGGLSKKWENNYGTYFAQEFSLKIIELNPSIAYKVSNNFSIGAGLRALYSEGIVKSDHPLKKRDMEGDTIEYGYNLAVAYKPSSRSNFSVTYRSNVNLNVEGSAKLYYSGGWNYNGNAKVNIPLPAVLTAALAYDFEDTTVEFEYDKTYWSKYKELDFNYETTQPVFDTPVAKNWKDTHAYRIGITHRYNDTLSLMAGFAVDQNPAPDTTLGFELPDSDAKLYSVGCDYKFDNRSSIGFGYLYDKKETRGVTNSGGINGIFSDASAHLVSFGYRTAF